MKKNLHIALILVMIFLYGNAFGQTTGSGSEKTKDSTKTAKTYLDLVLNVMSTNFNYGNSNTALQDYKKSILGAQLGVSFQAGITPSFSLVPEFYITTMGGKLKASNPLTNSESTLRLYAFELPVLARLHFSDFHINAGPSIAYNFYGSQKTDGSSADLSFNQSEGGVKHFDAGIQMGGGYTFHTKTKRITLDLRYNYGLTNISYSHEMYNRSFIISLHLSNPWKTNPFGKK
ncbi:MAG TPA: porin family protein [Mucilaginibacter sp.]|nr:porin family protein [Mucilaginibacter sp.]